MERYEIQLTDEQRHEIEGGQFSSFWAQYQKTYQETMIFLHVLFALVMSVLAILLYIVI